MLFLRRGQSQVKQTFRLHGDRIIPVAECDPALSDAVHQSLQDRADAFLVLKGIVAKAALSSFHGCLSLTRLDGFISFRISFGKGSHD